MNRTSRLARSLVPAAPFPFAALAALTVLLALGACLAEQDAPGDEGRPAPAAAPTAPSDEAAATCRRDEVASGDAASPLGTCGGCSNGRLCDGTWLGPQACGTRVCGYDRKWYVCGAPLMGGYTCSSMICHWLPQGPCGC